MTFDRASQPVAADDACSMATRSTARCMRSTRRQGASFGPSHDAPVRFAPARWRDRLFVASDDGFLYALAAQDGRLLWKRRAGRITRRAGQPAVDLPLACSRRTGWSTTWCTSPRASGPARDLLVRLDAQSGEVRWCNDDSAACTCAAPRRGQRLQRRLGASYLASRATCCWSQPAAPCRPRSIGRRGTEVLSFAGYGHDGSAAVTADGPLMFKADRPLGPTRATRCSASARSAGRGRGVRGTWHRGGAGRGESCCVAADDRKGNPLDTWTWQAQYQIPEVAGDAALILAGDKLVCGSKDRCRWSTGHSAGVWRLAWKALLTVGCSGRVLAGQHGPGLLYGFRPSASVGTSASVAADAAPRQQPGRA